MTPGKVLAVIGTLLFGIVTFAIASFLILFVGTIATKGLFVPSVAAIFLPDGDDLEKRLDEAVDLTVENGNASTCDKLKSPVRYVDYAYPPKDAKGELPKTLQILERDIKTWCYYDYAVKTDDISACDALQKWQENPGAIDYSVDTNDLLRTKNRCFIDVATKKQDIDLCDLMNDGDQICKGLLSADAKYCLSDSVGGLPSSLEVARCIRFVTDRYERGDYCGIITESSVGKEWKEYRTSCIGSLFSPSGLPSSVTKEACAYAVDQGEADRMRWIYERCVSRGLR